MKAAKQKMAATAAAELGNEKRVRVLQTIDKLRELGVSEKVSLPQLVVEGDQSSGKSSLLEGLTGLSFPIASDLCTRFATQIVLRRAPQDQAEARITILPGPSSQLDEHTAKRIKGFDKVLSTDQFDSKEFGCIFDEAAEFMGIPGPRSADVEDIDKRFSNDILKIELSGREHHHLSIVDVPGLFHNPTKFQTTEDRAIIRKLIDYSRIMDARNNLANQEVFSVARAADPAGKRPVGIITKCDAVEKGDEEGVMRIAKNEIEKLTHGWFAVKNRSTQEIKEGVTIEGRDRKEKEFFSSHTPWKELPKERVGIHALKDFLGGLLYNHIRNEFPNVTKDIEELLSSTENTLQLLGPSRDTSKDQRRFLTRIANLYQLEVGNALSGNYDPNLDSQSPLKLRMHIRKLNDHFYSIISKLGHARVFHTISGKPDPEFARGGETPKDDIYEWIRCIYRDSRGRELPGMVNPAVLETLFLQQSSPWRDFALSYLGDAIRLVRTYNNSVMVNIIPDEDVREKLSLHLLRIEHATYARAKEELSRILNDERNGVLQTVNHYFSTGLKSIREQRVRARLEAAGLIEGAYREITLLDALKEVNLSNEDQAIHDIHDTLKAYYKVAMKRFADNVIIQVVERHILGPDGPVRALCPDMVNDFDEGKLLDLAGEKPETTSMRNELSARRDRLRRALEIARRPSL